MNGKCCLPIPSDRKLIVNIAQADEAKLRHAPPTIMRPTSAVVLLKQRINTPNSCRRRPFSASERSCMSSLRRILRRNLSAHSALISHASLPRDDPDSVRPSDQSTAAADHIARHLPSARHLSLIKGQEGILMDKREFRARYVPENIISKSTFPFRVSAPKQGLQHAALERRMKVEWASVGAATTHSDLCRAPAPIPYSDCERRLRSM